MPAAAQSQSSVRMLAKALQPKWSLQPEMAKYEMQYAIFR